jgi:GDP-D-mannose 3', 5'-epimerase
MKSIMVTGGCGMIGSNLVKRLVKDGWDVYVADNLWRGKIEYLNGDDGKPVIDLDSHFFKKDLTVYSEAHDIIGITEYIVHLADVVAGIDYVFKNQGEIFRVNNLINSNVFNACRSAGKERVKGLIYVGTVCSFPLTRQNTLNPEPLQEDELFPALPESAYGWSKLMGQIEMGYLEKETGIPCCILMFHNVYGTPTDFGERSQVIPALIRKSINYPNEPFNVWGSGLQGRAFIHVDDTVNALCLALEKGWGHGHIQIGPSVCTSIKGIAETIVKISGKDINTFYDTSKPEGDKARCADYTKANEVLGWEPMVSLEEGLKQSYDWIEKQIKVKYCLAT